MTLSAAGNSGASRFGSGLARAVSGIRFRIWLAILGAAALPALLVVPAQLHRVQSSLAQHAEDMLLQVAQVQQRRINAELRQMGNQASLIASRTQMRLQLSEFNRSSAQSAGDFVTLVLEDALATAESIDSLWVYALDGKPVTGVGPTAVQHADPVLEHPTWRNEWFLRQIYWPVKDADCQSSLWLTTPLLLDDGTIGVLVAKFSLVGLRELLADFPYAHLIGTSFILMPRMKVDPGCTPQALQLLWSVTPSVRDWDRETLNDYWDLPNAELVRWEESDGGASVLALPIDFGIGRLYTQSRSRLPETLRQEILGGSGISLALVLLLALIVSFWAARWLAVPVSLLSRSVGNIRGGTAWTPVDSRGWPRELVTLADAVNESGEAVVRHTDALRREIRKRREAQDRFHTLANTDALTGLANRRHFLEHLTTVIAELQPDSPPVELVYLDLDRFKPVNDDHGHAVGDEVLKTVADRIRHLIRESDLAARLGGDEFAALVQFQEAGADRPGIVHRLTKAIEQPIRIGDITVGVGCSAGTVRLSPAMDVQTALRAADEQMYKVKVSRKAKAPVPQGV